MSELRIGLVAEGATDQIVIEAALNAILSEPFILQLLQPEATRPMLGGGWCGVLKWCLESSKSIESWVAAALLPGSDALLVDIECERALSARLAQLPLAQRVRKNRRDYNKHASKISRAWADVCGRCEQARRFHSAVQAAVGT